MMNFRVTPTVLALCLTVLALASTPTAAPAQNASALSSTELNTYRANNRRKPLGYSEQLAKAAALHAQDMAQNNFKSHTGSDGSSVGDRVRRQGYKWCHIAENITWGRRSAADAIAAWDGSAGHRKNLLGRKAREYGLAKGSGGLWVLVMARPC